MFEPFNFNHLLFYLDKYEYNSIGLINWPKILAIEITFGGQKNEKHSWTAMDGWMND